MNAFSSRRSWEASRMPTEGFSHRLPTTRAAMPLSTHRSPWPFRRPEFAFADLGGNRFDNRAAKGKPTVLAFSAIYWSALPPLRNAGTERLRPRRPRDGESVGGGGWDERPEKVKSFLAAHDLKLLHAAAGADFPPELGSAAFPTTIVIDRFGQIQFIHKGQLADVGAILGKDLRALPDLQ